MSECVLRNLTMFMYSWNGIVSFIKVINSKCSSKHHKNQVKVSQFITANERKILI